MPKRKQFCVAFVCLSLFTAGCAKEELIKKDEGIVPPPVSKQAEPKTSAGIAKQSPNMPGGKAAPLAPPSTSTQQNEKASSNLPMQSALEKIYFDFDSAILSESARASLARNADVLKHIAAKIRIEGNCDERGSAEYNLALGERRAKAAQQYLLTLGMESSRITTVSYGKEKPAVQGSDEAAMAKNRRDEFILMQ